MVLVYTKQFCHPIGKKYQAYQILKGGSVPHKIHFAVDSMSKLRLKIVIAGHTLAGRLINDYHNGKWLVKTDDNELMTTCEAYVKFSKDQKI